MNRFQKEIEYLNDEINLPEKEKINVYDNDDAYMLYDDKENGSMYDNEEIHLAEGENYVGGLDMEEMEENNYNDENGERDLSKYLDGNDNTARNQGDERGAKNSINSINRDVHGNNSQHTSFKKKVSERTSPTSNLITLKYISVCQCCKENFNSNTNIPFLLKCGHFFCRSCLINNFTEEDGTIICPDDGAIANSLKDLKLLNNLIIDKTINYEDETPSNTRDNHPGQKLSHYVEDTKEVICVYCAFNKFKKHPKYEIKEIRDKCQEILSEIDKTLVDNQTYVETLQQALKDIKDNKSAEEEKISNLYDEAIKFLDEKKNEMFENINTIFANNADKLSEKLDYFSTKMEDAEELKLSVVNIMENNNYQINDLLERYSQFTRENLDSTKLNLELTEYKFSHEDQNKLIKYLNNFGDLKSKLKIIRFFPKNNNVSSKTSNSIVENNSIPTQSNNMDLQYKNINNNLNNSLKKPYDSNFSAVNKYHYTNDLLNSSELLHDNSAYGRINTQKQTNYTFNVNELLVTDPNLRPNSSSNFKLILENYQNLNRNDFMGSKYNYTRPEYNFEQKNRDFNFSASNTYKSGDGKIKK